MPVLRHLRVAALLSALLVVPWLQPGDARATVDTSAVTQIKPDMTKDQVRAALGQPPRARHVGRTGEDVWRYPTPKFETFLEIVFSRDGRVISSQLVWVPPF